MEQIGKCFVSVIVFNVVILCFNLGEIYGLIGENGVGKLMLIKIFVGVYQVDSGSVIFDGYLLFFGNLVVIEVVGICVIYQELNLILYFIVVELVFLGQEYCICWGVLDY